MSPLSQLSSIGFCGQGSYRFFALKGDATPPTFREGKGWREGGEVVVWVRRGRPWEFRQSNFIVGTTRCILSGNTCE